MPYPSTLGHIATHTVLSSPITGYRLEGLWEIVEPIGANVINLVTNPSLEFNSTGYSAQGSATILRTAEWQRRGVYSLKITPTAATLDGAFYNSVNVVGGLTYTLSLDFKGAGGVKYRVYVANTTNNAVSMIKSFTATGGAQRISLTYTDAFTAGVTVARRIYITKDFNTSVIPFYIDGLSVTATPYPVTYFDGDSIGFIPGRLDFYWNGTRHGSTSTMANYTRAGGRITPLTKYGLTILALMGLGMQPITNISTPLAFIGGGQYQRTVSQERLFDIAGQLTAPNFATLQSNRSRLVNLLRPNATPSDTPLLLMYTPTDNCGNVIGETMEIPCVYESGMEGNITNHYQEPVALRFHSYLPYLGNHPGNVAQSLGYQKILSAGRLFGRDNLGNWSRLGTSLDQAVLVTLPLPDGRLLIGGLFTNADGNANADYLAIYDYSTNTISALNTTPLNSDVYALALLADGNTVIVGGAFSNAGGNPTADFICALNLTTGAFSALNLTALSAVRVNHIIVLPSGDIAVAGDITNAGGNANADHLIKINGTTFAFEAWNATPLDSEVETMVLLNNGDILFGGSGITSPVTHIGYLSVSTGAYSNPNTDTTTWASDSPAAMAVSPSGLAYLGASVGGGFYSWSGPGAAYTLLGTVSGGFLGNGITEIIALPNGNVLFSGQFANAGNLTLPGKLVGWNGSSFYYIDIETGDIAGTGYTDGLSISGDGKLVVGIAGGTIDGPAAFVNTIISTGSADAAPQFEILGPGNLYSLINFSTEESLYFNLTLLANERAVLDLTPGRIRFFSNFRPNLLGTILPGSSLATFRIIPGTNYLSVFIGGTVNVNTAISVRWRNAFWSLDGSTIAP